MSFDSSPENPFRQRGLWTLLLYLPYAFYMASFTYANGDEPGARESEPSQVDARFSSVHGFSALLGEFSEGIFVTLVVLSQIGLFVCSSIAAKKAGFWYEDQVGAGQCSFWRWFCGGNPNRSVAVTLTRPTSFDEFPVFA